MACDALWVQASQVVWVANHPLEGISMKTQIRALAVAVGLLCAASGFAQTAPLSTAVNSATTAATTAVGDAVSNAKAGAVTAMTPAAKTSAPVAAVAKAADTKPVATGGVGKVWVNTKSKTYHCEGTKSYGKTKTGEYMSEADAKAKGFRGIKGKSCAK
jgi:hypothetical protein